MNENDILTPRFFAYDKQAMKFQRNFKWCFYAQAIILFIIALFGFVIDIFFDKYLNQLNEIKTIKTINSFIVILLLLLIVLSILLKTYFRVSDWYETRAISESIKSLSWKFVTKAEPFNREDVESNELFINTIYEIEKFSKKPDLISGNIEFVTNKMNDFRTKSEKERLDFYINHRIRSQMSWYDKKAKEKKKFSNIFFVLILVFIITILIISVFSITNNKLKQIVDLGIAIISLTIGFDQMNQYSALSSAYRLTEKELSKIVQLYPNRNAELAVYVADCETAISREHTMWLARRDAGN